MRRLLLASVIGFACASVPRHSDAIIVECANCSDIVTQLLQEGQQVKQLATEAASLQTQLNSYAQMVTSGLTLPTSIWSNVQGDILQVRSLASAASLLTGNSGGIIARLQSAQGYANQAGYLPQNIGAQFTMWQQTIGNASNSLGRTLGVQQGQEQNYTALQAAIQAHSQTAAGQMQAIQSSNESLNLISTQMNQVQTTLTAAAQEQAARDAVEAERTAIADQYTVQFFAQPDASLTGWPRY